MRQVALQVDETWVEFGSRVVVVVVVGRGVNDVRGGLLVVAGSLELAEKYPRGSQLQDLIGQAGAGGREKLPIGAVQIWHPLPEWQRRWRGLTKAAFHAGDFSDEVGTALLHIHLHRQALHFEGNSNCHTRVSSATSTSLSVRSATSTSTSLLSSIEVESEL